MKAQREGEETAYTFTQMVTECVQRTMELKLRQEERERAVSELDKARKTTEAANKKLEQKKVLKAQDEADKKSAKLEIVELDQNLEVRVIPDGSLSPEPQPRDESAWMAASNPNPNLYLASR